MITYQITLNDNEQGLEAISFVEFPAIESPAMHFSDQQKFEFSEDQMIVSGPVLIPDIPIYRNDNNGEYNVVFTKDVIQELAIRYFRKKRCNNFDLNHSPDINDTDVTMFESYILGPHKKFRDLPYGTWCVSYKVNNPDVWAKIKESPISAGFSVELVAELGNAKLEEQTLEELINELLDEH